MATGVHGARASPNTAQAHTHRYAHTDILYIMPELASFAIDHIGYLVSYIGYLAERLFLTYHRLNTP